MARKEIEYPRALVWWFFGSLIVTGLGIVWFVIACALRISEWMLGGAFLSALGLAFISLSLEAGHWYNRREERDGT